MKTVFIVVAHGSQDLGDWREEVFSSRDKAEEWANKNVISDFTIEEWEVNN